MNFEIIIEGKSFTGKEDMGKLNSHPVMEFTYKWLYGGEQFEFQTSGSTGVPKKIVHSRQALESSAKRTIHALSLKQGTTALLCLNPSTIGGMMMVVRALVGGWKLTVIPPTSTPIPENSHFQFTAMAPFQLVKTIEKMGVNTLNSNIDCLLLGGSGVDLNLENTIQMLQFPVFIGYGMTETASHIALRKLNGNGKSDHYTILPGIETRLDHRNCLEIKADVTENQWVTTNDMVALNEDELRWEGRADFVINSGGVKIHPEEVEKMVKRCLLEDGITQELLVVGVPHSELGEELTLVTEGDPQFTLPYLRNRLQALLPTYSIPKTLRFLPLFSRISNDKPDRKAILKSLIH